MSNKTKKNEPTVEIPLDRLKLIFQNSNKVVQDELVTLVPELKPREITDLVKSVQDAIALVKPDEYTVVNHVLLQRKY